MPLVDIKELPAMFGPNESTSKVYFAKKVQLNKDAYIYRFSNASFNIHPADISKILLTLRRSLERKLDNVFN